MPDRSLDFLIAERVMGWRTSKISSNVWHSEVEHNSFHKDKFRPSESIEAAYQVEDRIAELGLQNDYIGHLWIVVGATRNGSNFWNADNFKAFWLCVHATAEQRCRAALAAVGDGN